MAALSTQMPMNGKNDPHVAQPLCYMTPNPQEISLYFHIPFCTKKCSYCHFYVLPDKEPYKVQLMEGFRLEWERWLPLIKDRKIKTIYFGGGTPALLGPQYIHEILDFIRKSVKFSSSSPEITLEANPENITSTLMTEFAQAGINRVSIGIQTLNDNLLQLLGRTHSSNKALDAVFATAKAGIENITIDLMYDLPDQTLQLWKETLHLVSTLPIKHLSLYNLTIEPHTTFFKHKEKIQKLLPNEEQSLNMYEMAIEKLESFGLQQYEISAFAQPGYQSQHNVGYWTAREFLGLGPSAFSYFNKHRFRNVANLSKYLQALQKNNSPIDFDELLNVDAQRRELLAINLRLKDGVDRVQFEKLHGPLDAETKQTLIDLQEQGFLVEQNQRLRLTKKGILFYDSVATELI